MGEKPEIRKPKTMLNSMPVLHNQSKEMGNKKLPDNQNGAECNSAEIGYIRRQWIDLIQKSSEHYDKTVVLIASGAIGLSLAFLNNIILKGVSNPLMLYCSWILLLVAILSSIVSHLTSIKGYADNINEIDYGTKPSKTWPKITDILNVVTLVCLFIGIVFLCLFAYQNILREDGDDMSKLNEGHPVISNPPAFKKDGDLQKGMPVVPNKPPIATPPRQAPQAGDKK